MAEKVILETTTKFNPRRLNKENFDTFTSQAAYSYGFVICVSWAVGMMILTVIVHFIRDLSFFPFDWHVTDDEFMAFSAVIGIASSYIAYFTGKHIKRIGMIDKYLSYIKSPTEVTTRQVEDGTERMNYSTGANINEVQLVAQREMIVNGEAEVWDASEHLLMDHIGDFTLLVEHVEWFREQYQNGDRYLRKIASGSDLGTQDIPSFAIRDDDYKAFSRLARGNGYTTQEGNKNLFTDKWVSEVLQLEPTGGE